MYRAQCLYGYVSYLLACLGQGGCDEAVTSKPAYTQTLPDAQNFVLIRLGGKPFNVALKTVVGTETSQFAP